MQAATHTKSALFAVELPKVARDDDNSERISMTSYPKQNGGCLLLAVSAGALFCACTLAKSQSNEAMMIQRGRTLVAWYGCIGCHEVPAMPLVGFVGPPLRGVARRSYLAGRLPNTPENMVRWIRHPGQVDTDTVMPEMNIGEQDARDIAAFLYTLH